MPTGQVARWRRTKARAAAARSLVRTPTTARRSWRWVAAARRRRGNSRTQGTHQVAQRLTTTGRPRRGGRGGGGEGDLADAGDAPGGPGVAPPGGAGGGGRVALAALQAREAQGR